MVDSPTPLSYCNDVNSFFTELLNERGIENFLSLIVKIGIDRQDKYPIAREDKH